MTYQVDNTLRVKAFNGLDEYSLPAATPAYFEDAQAFEDASNKLRIYAIVRGDLEMTTGKLASQACHAAKNCVGIAQKYEPSLYETYQGPDFIGTQIILKAKNEEAILKAYEAAKAAGLICSLIVDQHHVMLPHFDGNPIITALGIGPCTKEQAHAITKRFEMVK